MIILFGPLVWLSILIVGMILFRQNLKTHGWKIILTSIIVTIVKYILHYLHWQAAMTLIQPIVLMLCFHYLLRYRWQHAVIIISITYSIVGINELIVMYINYLLTDISIIEKYVNNDFSLSVHFIVLNIVFAMALKYFRIGFTFINQSYRSQRIDFLTQIIFVISLINTAIQSSVALALFNSFPIQYINLTLMAVIVFLILLLQINYRKELNDA